MHSLKSSRVRVILHLVLLEADQALHDLQVVLHAVMDLFDHHFLLLLAQHGLAQFQVGVLQVLFGHGQLFSASARFHQQPAGHAYEHREHHREEAGKDQQHLRLVPTRVQRGRFGSEPLFVHATRRSINLLLRTVQHDLEHGLRHALCAVTSEAKDHFLVQ